MEDFDLLSMFARRSKLVNFNQTLSLYFWNIVRNSDEFNLEVLDSCITKFADFIKYWPIEYKQPFFNELTTFLDSGSSPTIPVLKLLTSIIADHNEREKIMMKHSNNNAAATDNYGNVPKWVSPEDQQPVEIATVLDKL